MTSIRWLIKTFDELSVRQLYALLKRRQDVFVLEQDCLYADLDELDDAAWHVLGQGETGLLAYSRILAPGVRFDEPAIGRVLVESSHRKFGYGRLLMQQSIRHCQRLFPGRAIRISAQCYLQYFYQSLGFVLVSEPYDEDGIPHVEMLLPPT